MPLPNRVPRCYQVSFGMNVPEPRLGMAQCLIGTEAPALTFIALKGWPMAGKEVMPIDSVIVSIRGHRVIRPPILLGSTGWKLAHSTRR